MKYPAHHSALRVITIILVFFCCTVLPSSALYEFEGVPLRMAAEGQIQGDALIFYTLGLDVPPRECRFDLPADTEWARIYTGVWGGTEKYKGWVQVTANGETMDKIELFGEDDKNQNVYASGHGVYWVATDATALLQKGPNVISVITSRGEEGNKLDGRIYGVVIIAMVNQPGAPVIRYWVAEGNENLHGEGWSGTNPTRHLSANVTLSGADSNNNLEAKLTTLVLASNSGQPDYITLNSHDLGNPVSIPANYPEGARDLGNELSFDADGGPGIDSRYMDLETMDVTPLIRDSNTVTFELGRDLNGDGTISTTGSKPEGEDYIHPCLAVLTIKEAGSRQTGPDLFIENINAVNTYEGTNATISATLKNRGSPPATPAEIFFRDGQEEIWKGTVVIDPSGIQTISSPWQASAGSHTLSVEVRALGDTDPANNIASAQIMVTTPPDLSVSAGVPYRSAVTTTTPPTQSPLFVFAPLLGICTLFLLGRKRRMNALALPVIFIIVLASLSPLICSPVRAAGGSILYTMPVMISNHGGSDAPPFDITIYLDGEKTVTKTLESGIPAEGTQQVDITLYTSPGRHCVRIVADEAARISEQDRSNNVFDQTIDFP